MPFQKSQSANLPLWLSAFIFAIVGTVQLIRLFEQWPVIIDTYAVPLWVSAIVAAITWTMSGWLVYAAKQAK